MRNYVQLSLETHLYGARIIKEHMVFLECGFMCRDRTWIRQTDVLRRQLELLLQSAVQLGNGRVSRQVLESGELVTKCTMAAEQRTMKLTGVTIDSRITAMQQQLCCADKNEEGGEIRQRVNGLHQRALQHLDAVISFQEKLLKELEKGQVFQTTYALMIKHMLLETKQYREMVCTLLENQGLAEKGAEETACFWNRIMLEHAQFVRGLSDPSEEELINKADCYVLEYRALLQETSKAAEAKGLTERFREFNAAGEEGLLACRISAIYLPLLADHMLREANHYIRLLQ